MSVSYVSTIERIAVQLEIATDNANREAAAAYIKAYREALAPFNFSRHRVMIKIQYGTAVLCIGDRPVGWLHHSMFRRSAGLRSLRMIQSNINHNLTQYLVGAVLNPPKAPK